MLRGGESLTLRLVQEDVIAEQLDARGGNRLHRRTGPGGGCRSQRGRPPEILEGCQLENQANRMGLEGDQRQGLPDSVTEPEVEGNDEALGLARGRGGEDIGVADNGVEGCTLVGGHRVGSPHVHPGTGVLVDFLVTDFDAHLLNHGVTDVIHPVALDRWVNSGVRGQCGKVDFQKEGIEELRLAGNDTGDAPTEIGSAVKFDGNGLNREGRVAAIDMLEEGGLWITGQIGILPAARHQL